MWGIIISIVSTFIITALWQSIATKRNRQSIQAVIWGMVGEMDLMAQKLGYQDYVTYVNNTKSIEEAETILTNINNTLLCLNEKQ